MLVDAVKERLQDRVPDLESRIEGAASWTQIKSTRELPQRTPAAFVLPIGRTGGAVTAATGMFRQDVTSAIAVVVVVRSNDALGKRGLDRLESLLSCIETAICGWQPEGEMDCFALRKGELLASQNGTVIYQIDFTLPQQLRI